MLKTVEGVYRDGKVELSEQPSDVDNVRVLVVFTQDPARLETGPDGVRHDPATGISYGLPPGPERDKAIAELLATMRKGFDLGGGPYVKRDEFYDEVLDERDRSRR